MTAILLSAFSSGFGGAVLPSAITPELATVIGIFSCAAVFVAYSLFALQPRHRHQPLRRTTRRGMYESKQIIRTLSLPSSTTSANNAKSKVKFEDQHGFRPSAKSSIKDRIHRRLKSSKPRHGNTTTKVSCHFAGHHSIARNRARYNQSNPKSVKKFDKLEMDGSVSNNPSYEIRSRFHFCHHYHHPISRNRICYNRKRIELLSERITRLSDESTITAIANANEQSDEGFSRLNSQFTCEDINHTIVDDNPNKDKCGTKTTNSSDNKENVNPEIKSCHNIMAKVNRSANEKSALVPVTSCGQNHDDSSSHESNQLDYITKQSENSYTPSNLADASKNNVLDFSSANDDGHTTLHSENPPTLSQNNISDTDMHVKSSNESELTTSADQATTSHLTVLISSCIYEYVQASRQRDTLSLLNDLNISYVVVDGMDQSQKEKRDALFQISGIRGNYPQLFFTADDGTVPRFLGGYDWLQSTGINELDEIVGTTAKREETTTAGENRIIPPDS